MKKKIIFFSRDLNIGGMEKALISLLNALSDRGYCVTLVLENKIGVLMNELNPNILVKEYHLSNSKFIVFRKLYNFIHRVCWSMANRNKYDFSCNYATYSVIGSKLAYVASQNSALYVHSDYYNYFSKDKNAVKEFFISEGISELKHLLFVSNEACEPIKDIFPEFSGKFKVISNLVEVSEVIALSKKEEIEKPKNKELLVYVGRLDESSKKLSRLLESFSMLCSKSSNYELWIIGDGPDKLLCEELIAKFGLDRYVKMLGQKSNPYPYIKAASCVVLTSDYEGFPVIYNECITLKIPILTTIKVTDPFIDVSDYAIIVEKESESIAESLLKKDYAHISETNVDFTKINLLRIEQIEKIINEKGRFCE